VIARGAIDTGDQVFVDKFSYNFVKPKRGDVFVFRTDNVAMITADPETGAPYYIKRLTGLGGDEMRIEPPLLFVNGKPPEGLGFSRVMSAKDGYGGYRSAGEHMSDPTEPYRVPERSTSRWGIIARTASTAATGARCQRRTWSAAASWFTGRLRGIGV
jgi:signal peptidase I